MTDLEPAIAVVKTAIAQYDGAGGCRDAADYDAWKARRDAAGRIAEGMLGKAGATIHHGSETRLSFAGIRASSTQGLSMCLTHWLMTARQRQAAL